MILPKKNFTEEDSISLFGFILRILMILTIVGSFLWLVLKIAKAAENYHLKTEQHER